MEDVSHDRGQLILITGLVIAVVLVGTVMILNTAIYTENLATRDTGDDTSEAIEFRNVVIDGTREILGNENETDPEGALDQYFTQIEGHYAEDTTVVSVERTGEVADSSVEIILRYRTPDLRYEDTVEVSA